MVTYDFVQPTFTTQFGNQLLGFYITWGTDAASTSAVNTAAGGDNVKMSVTLNLATVGLSTATGEKLEPSVTAHDFTWYVAMMNGAMYNEATPSDYSASAFDFVQGLFDIQVTDASPDTLEVKWDGTTAIEDYHCEDALGATCVLDTAAGSTANYVNQEATTQDLCTELWQIDDGAGSFNVQCVKVEFEVVREFTLGTFASQPYDTTIDTETMLSINCGWTLNTETTNPYKQDFTA